MKRTLPSGLSKCRIGLYKWRKVSEMPRIAIDVPDFMADPKQRAKFEKALEGTEPGLYVLDVQHEELCLERLGRGACNCDVQFKAIKA
jgi:hypothetical protein